MHQGLTDYLSINVKELLGRMLNDVESKVDPGTLFVKGSLEIPLQSPRVSIIGSRKASPRGIENTQKITKMLVENQAIIVSGLAEGVDTVAHKTALSMNGKTIAIIGTPLDKVYPKINYELQQELMKNHLVISQFPIGSPIARKNFVIRNKTMALVSDASIIVEAGKTSGSRYQGWETLRMGRSLFICESVVNDKVKWAAEMIKHGAIELADSFDPFDILEELPSRFKVVDVFK